jgi:hypothetical protein
MEGRGIVAVHITAGNITVANFNITTSNAPLRFSILLFPFSESFPFIEYTVRFSTIINGTTVFVIIIGSVRKQLLPLHLIQGRLRFAFYLPLPSLATTKVVINYHVRRQR